MKPRSAVVWFTVALCIAVSSTLAALAVQQRGELNSETFLPAVYAHSDFTPQTQLEVTIAALITENAQQATAVSRQEQSISYLSTQQPAQNRVREVDVLTYENHYLQTQVAALYVALGSPVPPPPPSPTFGPPPIPTRTPTTTASVLLTSTPTLTPEEAVAP